MITYLTGWDDQHQIYLHWGVGYICGHLFRYAVESHSPSMTDAEQAMIDEAFEMQVLSYVDTSGEVH